MEGQYIVKVTYQYSKGLFIIHYARNKVTRWGPEKDVQGALPPTDDRKWRLRHCNRIVTKGM